MVTVQPDGSGRQKSCLHDFELLLPAEGAPGYEQRQPRSGGKRVRAALRMVRAELLHTFFILYHEFIKIYSPKRQLFTETAHSNK